MSREQVARDVVVSGEVQGVGFRWSTQAEAQRLGVTGWVRNEVDGRVTGHLEGPPLAVAALVAWLHRGPTYARVDGVDVRDVTPAGDTTFRVR